jgi:hypothetical protein
MGKRNKRPALRPGVSGFNENFTTPVGFADIPSSGRRGKPGCFPLLPLTEEADRTLVLRSGKRGCANLPLIKITEGN